MWKQIEPLTVEEQEHRRKVQVTVGRIPILRFALHVSNIAVIAVTIISLYLIATGQIA